MTLHNGWLLIIFDILWVVLCCALSLPMSEYDYGYCQKQQLVSTAKINRLNERSLKAVVRDLITRRTTAQRLAIDRRYDRGFNGLPRQ